MIEGKNKAIDTLRLQKSSDRFLLTTGNKAIYGKMVESSFYFKAAKPFLAHTVTFCKATPVSLPGSQGLTPGKLLTAVKRDIKHWGGIRET